MMLPIEKEGERGEEREKEREREGGKGKRGEKDETNAIIKKEKRTQKHIKERDKTL